MWTDIFRVTIGFARFKHGDRILYCELNPNSWIRLNIFATVSVVLQYLIWILSMDVECTLHTASLHCNQSFLFFFFRKEKSPRTLWFGSTGESIKSKSQMVYTGQTRLNFKMIFPVFTTTFELPGTRVVNLLYQPNCRAKWNSLKYLCDNLSENNISKVLKIAFKSRRTRIPFETFLGKISFASKWVWKKKLRFF